MIRHVVLFKLKDEAEGGDKATNAARIAGSLEALVGKIDGLLRLEVGRDVVGLPGAWDLALVADLEDEEALKNYQVHPLHVEAGKFISVVRSDRAVVDYRV